LDVKALQAIFQLLQARAFPHLIIVYQPQYSCSHQL